MIGSNSKNRSIIYLVIILLAVFAPIVLSNEYIRHLLVLTIIFSIFGLSYDLTIGGMGQVSLGHQAFFGLGAYIAALLSVRLQVPVWLGLPAAVVGTGLLGLFIGFISLRTRGAYLAIVMLGFAMILWMIIMGWREVPFGQTGVSGIPPVSISFPFLPELILIQSVPHLLFLDHENEFSRVINELNNIILNNTWDPVTTTT